MYTYNWPGNVRELRNLIERITIVSANESKENIDKLDHLENLSGCCGVKIFMGASTGELLVEDDESLRKILSTGKRRVAVHSEDEYRLKDRKNIIEKKDGFVPLAHLDCAAFLIPTNTSLSAPLTA